MLAHTRLHAQQVRTRCACARPDASWVAPRLRTPAACLAQLICCLVALCVCHGRWRWLLALREPRQSSQRRAGLDCGLGRLRGAGRPRPRAKAGREPEPGQEWWGRCWARPRPDERAAGRGAAVGVFPMRVPLAPWGRWDPREGASPTMRKFKIRKGLEGLTAGSSSAAQPPPSQPPAPAGSREPEITEMLQGNTCSSARRHCGSHGAQARLISWSHVPFSQGDFHCWMSCPMKRER
ncbi:uncharacterized protein LOC143658318 [Tamandua tetradactyla]|uniref:uncharacterized protein LOC143658318 n=1 Tax=Tamandua tetradactyla TaxID=48850 RepID=UPI0040546AEC